MINCYWLFKGTMGCGKQIFKQFHIISGPWLVVDWNMWNYHLAVCQNLVPLVNIKIAGKWMFIPLKMVLIGIDP
jgi:hypothetical protein